MPWQGLWRNLWNREEGNQAIEIGEKEVIIKVGSIKNIVWMRMLFNLFLLITAGFAIVLAVYLLPVEPMRVNVQKS